MGGSTPHHGTIVWVNSDFAYLADPPVFLPMQEPEMAQLMANVARAGAIR